MKFSNEFRMKVFNTLDKVKRDIDQSQDLVRNEMPIGDTDIDNFNERINLIISQLKSIKDEVTTEFERKK